MRGFRRGPPPPIIKNLPKKKVPTRRKKISRAKKVSLKPRFQFTNGYWNLIMWKWIRM